MPVSKPGRGRRPFHGRKGLHGIAQPRVCTESVYEVPNALLDHVGVAAAPITRVDRDN